MADCLSALWCFSKSSGAHPEAHLLWTLLASSVHVSWLTRGEHSSRRLGVQRRGRGWFVAQHYIYQSHERHLLSKLPPLDSGLFHIHSHTRSQSPNCLSIFSPAPTFFSHFPSTCNSAPHPVLLRDSWDDHRCGWSLQATPQVHRLFQETKDLWQQMMLFQVTQCLQTQKQINQKKTVTKQI